MPLIVGVGFLLHAAVGALIAVSGLIMPSWAVAALAFAWLVALVVAVRNRHRAGVVVLAPTVVFGTWVLAAWLGDVLLDWSA